MENAGKAIAIAAVWGGVALLSYLFNSSGILTVGGAGLMVLGATLLTIGLWKM